MGQQLKPKTPLSKLKASSINSLDYKLNQLKKSATTVSNQLRLSTKAHYEHLAQLYLWWCTASKIPDYLTGKYEEASIKDKKSSTQAINFSPLLRLAWGKDNLLSDDKLWRWSVVLNHLHLKYEADEYFLTDSVLRLADCIHEAGGVDGIIGYQKQPKEGIDSLDNASQVDAMESSSTNFLKQMPRKLFEQLYSSAAKFYGSVSRPANISLVAPIPLSDRMGIVLVREVGGQYQFISANNDPYYLQQVATVAYLQDFSALPQSIRLIMELLSTQCLPAHLQKLHRRLLVRKIDAGKITVINRVMYHHANAEWILSPVNVCCGVITIAKPRKPILSNVQNDLFMLQRDRRAIERQLISIRKFNLFEPPHLDQIAFVQRDGYGSYRLKLQNKYDKAEQLTADFLPYAQHTPVANSQLLPGNSGLPFNWQATLSYAWFCKFSLAVAAKWLANLGRHITRKPNEVMRLDLDSTNLTCSFDYRDGKFARSQHITFDDDSIVTGQCSLYVLSKDFVMVMQAIAELDVINSLEVALDTSVMQIKFATAAADYQIYIPTCTTEGVCSSDYFEQYTPVQIPIDIRSDYLEQIAGELSEKAE